MNQHIPVISGYSRFFASCGFYKPNHNAFIIKDALEFWMETKRFEQLMKGKCCCILNANDRWNTPIVCDNSPAVFKSGHRDKFNYCETHLQHRKKDVMKYLGYNPIRVGRMKRRRPRNLKTIVKMSTKDWEEEDVMLALRSLKQAKR